MRDRSTLVLDTNTLRDRAFLSWLRRYRGRKVLPVVAFVEAGVFFRSRDDLAALHSLVRACGFEIEWLRASEADTAIETAHMVKDFAQNARDHLIAAHAAAPGRILVTNNLRDFRFLAKVASPAQIMQKPASRRT